ncbi:MAG TPA: hypothetical protein VKC51_08755 [Lacunisphaera sp.]|nr:hypothetical protein [Lacunisphaera sp.]
MKKTLQILLALFSSSALGAAERPNTVLIHPGETCYVRFAINGAKLKLLGVSKEKDESAQVVLSVYPAPSNNGFTLKVENKFNLDLDYAGELRSHLIDRRIKVSMAPVVAGKISLEWLPLKLDELAVFGFKLEK